MEKNKECDLEGESLQEILVRLPVHCVFRFKCVSKHWNSIISKPSFAHFYVSRITETSKLNHRFLLLFDAVVLDEPRRRIRGLSPPTADSQLRKIIRDESKLPLMEGENKPHRAVTFFYLPPRRVKEYNVIAASNGFLLLCTIGDYYVYNFVTREIVAIPAPRRLCNPNIGFITQMKQILVESFRIVQALKQKQHLVFHVYSSETGKWNEQRFPLHIRLLGCWDSRTPKFAFRGHLHWVERSTGILAYDPFNQRQCRLLRFPNPRSVPNFCFSVSEEYIRLVETPKPEAEFGMEFWTCTVWRLEDYEKQEWCLEHRITYDWKRSTRRITRPIRFLIPLLCAPYDPQVVYLWNSKVGEVISFNLRTGKSLIDYSWKPYRYEFTIKPVLHAEIPIWPSPIPRPLPPNKTRI